MSLVARRPLPADPPADGARPPGARRWRWWRWRWWRSPDGQPGWARPALLGVAALAGLLYSWNIARVDMSPYYPVAVKSMSESWKALLYGGFDPRASITLDKLSGSFVPQALSVRIFGMHPWSLALPQVVEGVVTVLVTYRVVRRWAGATAGLVAAGIFATTPIAASVFGHGMEDGCLVMCLVFAADACQRATLTAGLRPLLLSGVWVGLGFQCKMIEAWMVLPALAAGYLVAAPAPLPRRLWRLGVAGAVTLAVSLSWVLLLTVTPAADRPFIDGSTDNSALAMVFGSNGLDRLGGSLPGAVSTATAGIPGTGQNGSTGATGFGKLLSGQYAPEIGWLFPLALVTLVLGLVWYRRATRTDPVRGGLIMWGGWLVTFGLVYSAMPSIAHTAYLTTLAPPVAALGGVGIVLFCRAYRAGGSRALALPAVAAAEVVWMVVVWSGYPDFLPWARWLTVATGGVAVVTLVTMRLSGRTGARLGLAGAVAAIVAILGSPAVWAGSVLDVAYGGSSFNASAGPAGQLQWSGTGHAGAQPTRGNLVGAVLGARTTLTPGEQRVYDYVQAHRAGAGYLMAVTSWVTASPYILATGQEVLPMGGFSGAVPAPTLSHVQDLVRTGQLRFVLIPTTQAVWGRPLAGGPTATITRWVQRTCRAVPARDYAVPSGSSGWGGGGVGVLYRCDE